MDLHDVYHQLTNMGGFNDEDYPEGIERVINLMVAILNHGLPKDSLIEAYVRPDYNTHTWVRIGWRMKDSHNDANEPGAQVDRILAKAIKHGWEIKQQISISRRVKIGR